MKRIDQFKKELKEDLWYFALFTGIGLSCDIIILIFYLILFLLERSHL